MNFALFTLSHCQANFAPDFRRGNCGKAVCVASCLKSTSHSGKPNYKLQNLRKIKQCKKTELAF